MLNERNMNYSQREFNTIKSFVGDRSEGELIMFICENFNKWIQEQPKELSEYILGFHKRFHFWGEFNPQEGKIEMIEQRAKILKNRWTEIEDFYNSLSDYRSKNVLVMILENWLSFYYGRIQRVKEHDFKSYFDLDLLPVSQEEVFVDLGAWRGDTLDEYIHSYGAGNYKKIYCYEIMDGNVQTLKEKCRMDPRVIIRPVGVSDKKGTMYIEDNGTTDAQSLSESGTKPIETVTLDEDITEPITFLKMDIEGAEKKAILGARRHISKECPKLAISIYHSNEDLLDIFNLIRSIQPDYRFYLRYNGLPYFPTDYILIAIPVKS